MSQRKGEGGFRPPEPANAHKRSVKDPCMKQAPVIKLLKIGLETPLPIKFFYWLDPGMNSPLDKRMSCLSAYKVGNGQI